MKKLRLLLASVIAFALAISALSLLLPKPGDAEVRLYYSPIATSVVLIDVLLAMGAAVLFLMALKNFKPELKPAYRLMAFSALAVGVGLLIFPYIEYYGRWDVIWFNVGSYAQYLVGAPLMYLGVRAFYKRVGMGGLVASLPVVLGAIVVLTIIHAMLPHFDVWPMWKEWGYDAFQTVTIIPVVAYAAAFYMAFRAQQKTGKEYQKAFIWLTIGLGMYVFNTAGIVTLETIGYENWYFDNRVYTAPAILGDLSLVFAGYYFAAVGLPVVLRRSWLLRLFGGKSHQASSVDIVTYAAQLASDRAKIDPLLDGLREVTFKHESTEDLSADEQNKLRAVYLAVENQLLTGDQLRNYSKDELRATITKRFDLEVLGDKTFWPSLGA